MLAGIVTPPLILGGSGGANLDPGTQQYLISASLIVCGILSSIQITRFHLLKTPYYIGTGLIRFAFATVSLMKVLSGLLLQPFRWQLGHLRSGTLTAHAQSILQGLASLAQMAMAPSSERPASVLFSKLA
jgi:xanthine/uracil permease